MLHFKILKTVSEIISNDQHGIAKCTGCKLELHCRPHIDFRLNDSEIDNTHLACIVNLQVVQEV